MARDDDDIWADNSASGAANKASGSSVEKPDLSGFSISELEQRLEELQSEITRCSDMIENKKRSFGDANNVFKS